MYWILFLIPALAVLLPWRLSPSLRKGAWWSVAAFYAVVIGLRHQVGGDWYNYLYLFREISSLPYDQTIIYRDPGYYQLGWLIARLGGDIYAVNLACAILVVYGIVAYSRTQPLPWLALLVSVPYLIVVVAMGYTRQSVALGCAMIGLVELGKGKALKYVVWVLVGALFHKTAVVLLPIAALAASRRRLWTFTWVGITTVTAELSLLGGSTDRIWANYVNGDMQSQGALIRSLMNVVPSAVLLVFRKRIGIAGNEIRLYTWIAIFSMICVPLVQVASTAVDRIALYFIPIQIFVLARTHRLAGGVAGRTAIVLAIVAYSALVLFVWLNYAQFASYWVPYRFMPLRSWQS